MKLFELNADTGLPQFDPIVFELGPFRDLIAKDKSKNKTIAKTELAFIWFYADPQSEFYGIAEIEEIKKILDLPKSWTISEELSKAIEFYKGFIATTATKLLEKMKMTIDKLSDHLGDINFETKDENGRLVYDMKKVVDTASQIPKLLASLREIEIRVKEEQEELEKEVRGKKQLAAWEDGIE